MTEEKKPVGRPKERPEGEISLKSRLPMNLYRVLKGVSGLRGISMNDAVIESVDLWSKQYPALVAAVDTLPGESSVKPKSSAAKKSPAAKASAAKKSSPAKKAAKKAK